MTSNLLAALRAVWDSCWFRNNAPRPKEVVRKLGLMGVLTAACLLTPTATQAGLYQSDAVPLKQFGFSTGSKPTPSELLHILDITKRVLGDGAIIRTGLTWDPTKRSFPNFADWSATVL